MSCFKETSKKLYLKCRTPNCNQAFQTFHSVQALNVHHRIFHPKVLFRCRICPKIHHNQVQIGTTNMSINNQFMRAHDVINFSYSRASYNSTEECISNSDYISASLVDAQKVTNIHKTSPDMPTSISPKGLSVRFVIAVEAPFCSAPKYSTLLLQEVWCGLHSL